MNQSPSYPYTPPNQSSYTPPPPQPVSSSSQQQNINPLQNPLTPTHLVPASSQSAQSPSPLPSPMSTMVPPTIPMQQPPVEDEDPLIGKRSLKNYLIVGGVMLAVLLILSGFIFVPMLTATSTPYGTVRQFYRDLEGNNYTTAYALFDTHVSVNLQANPLPASAAALAAQSEQLNQAIGDIQLVNPVSVTTSGTVTTVVVRVTRQGTTGFNDQTYRLLNLNGSWQIISYSDI